MNQVFSLSEVKIAAKKAYLPRRRLLNTTQGLKLQLGTRNSFYMAAFRSSDREPYSYICQISSASSLVATWPSLTRMPSSHSISFLISRRMCNQSHLKNGIKLYFQFTRAFWRPIRTSIHERKFDMGRSSHLRIGTPWYSGVHHGGYSRPGPKDCEVLHRSR